MALLCWAAYAAYSSVFIIVDERPKDDGHAERGKDIRSSNTQIQSSLEHRDAPPIVESLGIHHSVMICEMELSDSLPMHLCGIVTRYANF